MKTLFEQGLELEKQGDYENALKLYLQASEKGDDEADCRIGNIYRFGRGFTKDYEKALYYYHRSAEKGNSYADSAYLSCRPDDRPCPFDEKKYPSPQRRPSVFDGKILCRSGNRMQYLFQ